MKIHDKVVLITGASEGIGAATAGVLRKRGALLSLTARSAQKLQTVAGKDALWIAGDITDPATRRSVVDETLSRYGRIDILINNAGAGLYAPAWKVPAEKSRQIFELNFFAPLELIGLVVPQMRERRSGAIVNVGSIAGLVTLPWFTLYSATKYALGSLTEGLRMELASDGVHAMLVCPGYVQTAFQEHTLGGAPPQSIASRKKFAITAEACAEAIARGLERDARTVITPAIGKAFVTASRIAPGLIEKKLAGMRGNP
jgi:short-subunit dehydrogenase